MSNEEPQTKLECECDIKEVRFKCLDSFGFCIHCGREIQKRVGGKKSLSELRGESW